MILFVYGSLRRGQFNHIRNTIDMRRCAFLGMSKTKPEFTLVSFGQYPGLYIGGTTAVTGELYELPDKHPIAIEIEHMEQSAGYKREDIVLEDGRTVRAYIHHGVLRKGSQIVESGDWVAYHKPSEAEVRHMASQENWVLKWAEDEAYREKLAAEIDTKKMDLPEAVKILVERILDNDNGELDKDDEDNFDPELYLAVNAAAAWSKEAVCKST